MEVRGLLSFLSFLSLPRFAGGLDARRIDCACFIDGRTGVGERIAVAVTNCEDVHGTRGRLYAVADGEVVEELLDGDAVAVDDRLLDGGLRVLRFILRFGREVVLLVLLLVGFVLSH